MNRELIDRAARALAIDAVNLCGSRLKAKAGFSLHTFDEELSLVPQYKSGPTGRLACVTPGTASPETAPTLVLIHFGAGVRLVNGEALAAIKHGEDVPEEAQYLEIEGEFYAQYRLSPAADFESLRPAIEEFGRYNLGYHVWPYWREYVQSTCSRMGIPPIPVPMYRLPTENASDAAE